eukprot:TRINITY_DN4011_c0_g1_i5.p1 TRINITY_DN4011_c0_g1~~TRINITY_DN4011_c0_g1_i5.p1  ORF type:complete len:310 (-),score=92.46 TRINITY_DN4011_c0_g1_i5:2-931(-)
MKKWDRYTEEREREALLSPPGRSSPSFLPLSSFGKGGKSVPGPSSPNIPVVQPLVSTQDDTIATSTPIAAGGGENSTATVPAVIVPTPGVPGIEIEACTPDPVSPSRQKLRLDVSEGNRLPNSGSRHSLSKVFAEQKKRKEERRQRSAQLPAHGEVQKLEQSLLKLLHEFDTGENPDFDSTYSLQQMESVRDQQESLARLHFELGAQQDLHPQLSDDGLKLARENMSQLISRLEKLSMAIGNLSCLDRMVDPSIKVIDEIDRRGPLVRGDTDRSSGREENSQFSRRSTLSNMTDMPEEEEVMYFKSLAP